MAGGYVPLLVGGMWSHRAKGMDTEEAKEVVTMIQSAMSLPCSPKESDES